MAKYKVGDKETYHELIERIELLEMQVAENSRLLDGYLSKQSQPNPVNMYEWKDGRLRILSEPSKKTANELRKEAIKKAKKFVTDVVARGTNISAFNDGTGGNHTYQKRFYAVDFVVNDDKRTVVALVHQTNHRGDIVTWAAHKGIAKCAPDDVFNADIGKALAVGRAFGLDTTDFEMAPQPDGYEDGMVLTFPKEASWHRKVNYVIDGLGSRSDNLRIIKDEMTDELGTPSQVGERAYTWSKTFLTIISDTEAEY